MRYALLVHLPKFLISQAGSPAAAAVVAIRVCSSNNAHTMLLMQCAHMSSRKINCGMLLGILSHVSEKPACS